MRLSRKRQNFTKLTFSRFDLEKSQPARSAAISSEFVKSAPERFAFAKNTPVKLTSLKLAFMKDDEEVTSFSI